MPVSKNLFNDQKMTRIGNSSHELKSLSLVYCLLGSMGTIFYLIFIYFLLSFGSFDFSSIFILICGLVCPICLLLSGIFMAQKRNYYFSLILACLECMSMPLFFPLAILGLITVFVMSQDSVKRLYGLKL